MRKKLIALAAILVAAAAAGGLASARGAAPQQQIALAYAGNAPMTMTPLTAGSLQSDTGSTTWCCWTQKVVKQDGEQLDVDNPLATFVGNHGTLKWRERITWHDLGSNYSVAAGTWKIVRGTGAYEHLAGHGHLVFVQKGDKTLAYRALGLVGRGG